MGINIYLRIFSERITQEQWQAVYEESLKLLEAFPFMDVIIKEKNGKKYRCGTRTKSRKIKSDQDCLGWHTIGDMTNGSTTESFTLYNDIREYQYGLNVESDRSDILLSRLNFDNKNYDAITPKSVFYGKTQGALTHIPLLGIACMIIDMLPEGSADVYGDINLAQCRRAVRWVNEVLGKQIQLPVECYHERLFERLRKAGLTGTDLVSALLRLTLEAKDVQFGEFLNENLSDAVYLYYRDKFMDLKTDMLGFRDYLHEYLQMGLSFENLCKMLVTDSNGKQITPKEFLSVIADIKLHVKEKETYDFTRVDSDNADKEEVDTIDMMMSRVFAKLVGAGNKNVNAYIPFENIKDICKRVFGSGYDIDTIMIDVLQEQKENSKDSSIQSRLYDGSLEEIAIALDKSIKQYDVYDFDSLDKWYEGCSVAPDIDANLFQSCKRLYDISHKKVLEFKKLEQKEREDFILDYIDSYILLTDEFWDKIWSNIMNDNYIEMVLALVLIDRRTNGGYKMCKTMFRHFNMYEYYWKKIKAGC